MSIKSMFNSIYFTWAVLAIPSIGMLARLINGAGIGSLLHSTGEFSARFMIIAMMLSPLLMLFPRSTIIKWLIRRRRALGVAAFCYAAVHTLFYLVDMGSVQMILEDFWLLSIWTGWLAFAIFIPLALTSNKMMVKKLRTKWKPLQRFVYVAAVFTLLHWIFVHNHLGPALVHFLPLAALEGYRIIRNYKERTQRTA